LLEIETDDPATPFNITARVRVEAEASRRLIWKPLHAYARSGVR